MFEIEIRDSTTVTRWNIVRTLRNQSLADHQFYVATYASQICEYLEFDPVLTLECLRFALVHDSQEEIFTSDLPGPAKKSIIRKQSAEEAVEHWHGLVFGKPTMKPSKLAKLVVKLADELDALFEMCTEFMMGNRYAYDHVQPSLARANTACDNLASEAGLSYTKRAGLEAAIAAAVGHHTHSMPKGPVVVTK